MKVETTPKRNTALDETPNDMTRMDCPAGVNRFWSKIKEKHNNKASY